jgi:hypothetical protein
MKGPARLTAWASPFSARSFRSHLRCTSAKASGAFPVAGEGGSLVDPAKVEL